MTTLERPQSLVDAMGPAVDANETGTSLWVGAFRRLRRNPSAIVGYRLMAFYP